MGVLSCLHAGRASARFGTSVGSVDALTTNDAACEAGFGARGHLSARAAGSSGPRGATLTCFQEHRVLPDLLIDFVAADEGREHSPGYFAALLPQAPLSALQLAAAQDQGNLADGEKRGLERRSSLKKSQALDATPNFVYRMFGVGNPAGAA